MHLQDLYHESDPGYNGRFTVPVLYDKKTKTIVNNEVSVAVQDQNASSNDERLTALAASWLEF